ncbi:copper resistance protein CopC [Streptomyces sp. NPDC046716]|uniref:copper resistance CopC/CopD family protein n=1 Tax=Streptomyces sp. NPDC046716 TaxID=3157093 RepID=UPI0033F3F2A1
MKTIAPRFRHLVLLFLAVTGALLAGAAPASAHAALTGSDPAQGAVVQQAPKQVSLTFSEEVAMSSGAVRVLDPSGKRVDNGKVGRLKGTTYTVGLHAGLPDGTFTVAYQVVSADSHPVSGAYTFSIGAPSKTSAVIADQNAGGGVVGALYGAGRYVSYAGFVLLVGGAAFVLLCWPRGAGIKPVQRVVVGGWTALTAATIALLLMRGSYTGSGKVADIFDMTLLGQVLQTKTGAALTSRLLLLAAAALFIAVLFGAYVKRAEDGDKKEIKDLTFGLSIGGAVVAAGLGATWAMAEHASTGIQAGLAMPVDVLHLLAVAAWLGGLTTLLVALYRAPSIEASAVRRFSRVAFCSVVVLAATGLYQSWRQVGSWSALTGTTYGQLLLVKVGLVAVLVGIAGISRRWTGRITAPVASATVVGQRAATSDESASEQDGSAATGSEQSGSATAGSEEAATASAAQAGSAEAGSAEAGSVETATAKAATAEAAFTEAGSSAEAASAKAATAEAGFTEAASAGTASAKAGSVETASAEAGSAKAGSVETASAEAGSAEARSVETASAEAGSERAKAERAGAERAEGIEPAEVKEPVAVASGGGRSGDPRRAAQLARQRAAMTTAREKRARDADPHRFGLRRSVLAEAGVAIVLLAVTTVLTSTEPGRTEEEAKSATSAAQTQSGPLSLKVPFDTGGEDGKGTVLLDIDPGRTGDNAMHVYVQRPNGKGFDVPEVKVAFTLKAKDIGPLSVTPDRIATGHWSASGVQIPVAGDWKIEVTVRTSDIDQITVSKNAKIG